MVTRTKKNKGTLIIPEKNKKDTDSTSFSKSKIYKLALGREDL